MIVEACFPDVLLNPKFVLKTLEKGVAYLPMFTEHVYLIWWIFTVPVETINCPVLNLNYFVIIVTTFFWITNDTFSSDFVGLKIENSSKCYEKWFPLGLKNSFEEFFAWALIHPQNFKKEPPPFSYQTCKYCQNKFWNSVNLLYFIMCLFLVCGKSKRRLGKKEIHPLIR